jgi:hypothetical protein
MVLKKEGGRCTQKRRPCIGWKVKLVFLSIAPLYAPCSPQTKTWRTLAPTITLGASVNDLCSGSSKKSRTMEDFDGNKAPKPLLGGCTSDRYISVLRERYIRTCNALRTTYSNCAVHLQKFLARSESLQERTPRLKPRLMDAHTDSTMHSQEVIPRGSLTSFPRAAGGWK